MYWIQWLNGNQGFVMALLTLVYVVSTIGIAILMARSNRLSRESLEQAVELDRRRSRPYVIFDIELRHNGIAYAVIKNMGLTAAYHVKLDLTMPLRKTFGAKSEESPLVSQEIGFLAPARSIEDLLNSMSHFMQDYPSLLFEGRLKYQDADGQTYDDPVRIDLSFEQHLSFSPEREIWREIEKLTKAVEALGRNLPRAIAQKSAEEG